MLEKYDKYLPIGTVILLKNGHKKLMIVGFAQVYLKEKNKKYDYSGCAYPEGMFNIKNFYFFNHDDIEQIYYLGYKNEEHDDFNKKLLEVANKNK